MGKTPGRQKSQTSPTEVRMWVKVLSGKDIEELRRRLAEKGTLWREWEYKLHRGNIVIYTPITPWNPATCEPDPESRYMAKHLRIVSCVPGPYGLEYFRHTGRWSPLPCVGSIEEIAEFIEADQIGLCAPTEPPVSVVRRE